MKKSKLAAMALASTLSLTILAGCSSGTPIMVSNTGASVIETSQVMTKSIEKSAKSQAGKIKKNIRRVKDGDRYNHIKKIEKQREHSITNIGKHLTIDKTIR